MKAYLILLSVLSVYSLQVYGINEVDQHKNRFATTLSKCNPCLMSVFRKYGASFLVGASIGTTTGTACRYSDNYLPWIVTWLFWLTVREELLEAAHYELQECELLNREEIDHCRDLMALVARITDWISYLS